MSELTTLAAEQATGRKLRCRYIRRGADRCTNEVVVPDGADPGDQDVILICPKHLHRAWQQFTEALELAEDGAP